MTSRIADVFVRLRADHRTGLVTYVTGGDPDAARSAEILRGLDRAGADVLEVGVPFSDPLADGPVIQRASERALAAGGNLSRTLDLIAQIRADVQAAVVVFTYANPIFKMGTDAFAARAAAAGVDGVLVLDLPIEEAGPFRQTVVDAGIDPIFLLSPTTTDLRIRAAAGFCMGSPGWGSRGYARRSPPVRAPWSNVFARSQRYRSRSASGCPGPSTCDRSGNGPMRRWWAVRWWT